MKKVISVLITTILLIAFTLPITASAANASADLVGPATVRAGDTVTFSFNLSGKNISGVSGKLSYNSNQLTLTGTSQKISAPWAVEFNGNNFVAYDNNLEKPINGNKTLFTATFKIKSLDVGTTVKVSLTGLKVSDGRSDIDLGTVSCSKTIAAPLSRNNELSSLSVGNATVTPAFSAKTTSYSASVPFEISKLDISAKAADSKAKVSINNPTLTPGGTTKVTVTVKAENGTVKTYTISVRRAQDPNYKPDSNCSLAGISVEGFLLSPKFSTDTSRYVVWVPYETEKVKISGVAASDKASVAAEGGENLTAGKDNPVKLICTAENGDKKEYTVIVKRAAPHNEATDAVPETPREEQSTPPSTTDLDADRTETNGIAWWWLPIVGLVSLIIGATATILIQKIRKQRKS